MGRACQSKEKNKQYAKTGHTTKFTVKPVLETLDCFFFSVHEKVSENAHTWHTWVIQKCVRFLRTVFDGCTYKITTASGLNRLNMEI